MVASELGGRGTFTTSFPFLPKRKPCVLVSYQGRMPKGKIDGGGIEVVFLRSGANPDDVRAEFARLLQLRVEKINVSRSHADVGGIKAGGASKSDKKIVHFEPVAVAVMQHVLDIGIFPEVFGFLLFCRFGNFHVEVTHLLNAGVDLAELDLGRIAGADDPGEFLF